MFGYVLPDKPEMKIKEYELFRAYYCGVCKSMGRNSGFSSRMALNYDAVFIGILLSSILGEQSDIHKEVCIANPIKKKPIVRNSKAIDFAADINTLLTFYKIKDDIADEGSIKSKIIYPLFSGARRKAIKRNSDIDDYISGIMNTQKELEDRLESSIDAAADPTGRMLAEILKQGYRKLSKPTDEKKERLIEWIGYNVGKWIYTLDAFDDIKIDIERKSYNPFVESFKKMDKPYLTEEAEKIKDIFRADAIFILESCLSQIGKSLELMNGENKGILENIVYLGMEKKMKEILNKKCNGECAN